MPGMMKTLQSNKSNKLPLMLFELQDTVIKTNENEIGAKNIRKLCAAYSNSSTSGFEVYLQSKIYFLVYPWIVRFCNE